MVSGGAAVGKASVCGAFETSAERSPKKNWNAFGLSLDCADADWLISAMAAIPITLARIELDRRFATGRPGHMERSVLILSLFLLC
jgi:hypothetical protein